MINFLYKYIDRRSGKAFRKEYERKKVNTDSILDIIKPGSSVYIESGCGEPQHLVKRLILENKKLTDVQIFTALPLNTYDDFGGEGGSRFRIKSFFVTPKISHAFSQGDTDHIPLSTSGVDMLFSKDFMTINTVLIQVSPASGRGYMSMGVSVDIARTIVKKADLVIAQVNKRMPVADGDCLIHTDEIDYFIEHDEPLVDYISESLDPETRQVGENIARLVENGSTIQVGFGRIPEAALKALKDKKQIGVHSEIINDTVVDLVKAGVITNEKKDVDRGKIVTSFCIGTDKVFDFVNSNPKVVLRDISYTSDPKIISSHKRFVAINGAVEIDLTGQSCVGMGEQMSYYGALGHAAFNRAAMYSSCGKGIIALRSTSRDGKASRIVPVFTDRSAGIITTQADVHWVVTEFGSVNLFGKSIRERALALITIAHPRFRAWLLDEAKRINYVYKDQILPPEEANYPHKYEHTRRFKGKTMFFRPIKITDEREIQNLFYTLSNSDKFHRFLMHVNALHHKQAQALTNVDYKDSTAIVVFNRDGTREHLIAVAHIARESEDKLASTCEFAIMVHPRWQNKGIGSYLVKYMSDIARDHGYGCMRAYIWEDNLQMFKVFKKIGCSINRSEEYRIHKIDIDILDINIF